VGYSDDFKNALAEQELGGMCRTAGGPYGDVERSGWVWNGTTFGPSFHLIGGEVFIPAAWSFV
jgi:hypothetical protein